MTLACPGQAVHSADGVTLGPAWVLARCPRSVALGTRHRSAIAREVVVPRCPQQFRPLRHAECLAGFNHVQLLHMPGNAAGRVPLRRH
jgi:hypothetical protein